MFYFRVCIIVFLLNFLDLNSCKNILLERLKGCCEELKHNDIGIEKKGLLSLANEIFCLKIVFFSKFDECFEGWNQLLKDFQI